MTAPHLGSALDRAGAVDYTLLARQARALFAGEHDFIANAANFSALVFQHLPDLNWAGFYFLRDGELVLGPFQGRTACVRIAIGKGVCGTSALRGEAIIVPDVHRFPGHIACDAASRSELVVPFRKGKELLGVFDLDSPRVNRFNERDRDGIALMLESLAATLPTEPA